MRKILSLVAAALTVLGVGGWLFAATQGTSIGIGVYWAVVSASTVGYGDFAPHNTAGRWIAVAVILIGGALLAAAVAAFTSIRVARHLAHRFDAIERKADAAHRISADLWHHHTGGSHRLAPPES